MSCTLKLTSFYGIQITLKDYIWPALELFMKEFLTYVKWSCTHNHVTHEVTLAIGVRFKTSFKQMGRHRMAVNGIDAGHFINELSEVEKAMVQKDFDRLNDVLGPIEPGYCTMTRFEY